MTLERPNQFYSGDPETSSHLTLRSLAVLAEEPGDRVEARRLWENSPRRLPRRRRGHGARRCGSLNRRACRQTASAGCPLVQPARSPKTPRIPHRKWSGHHSPVQPARADRRGSHYGDSAYPVSAGMIDDRPESAQGVRPVLPELSTGAFNTPIEARHLHHGSVVRQRAVGPHQRPGRIGRRPAHGMTSPVAGVRQVTLAAVHVRIVVRSRASLVEGHREIAPEVVLRGAVRAQRQERPRIGPAVAVGIIVGKPPAVAGPRRQYPAAGPVVVLLAVRASCRIRTLPGAS